MRGGRETHGLKNGTVYRVGLETLSLGLWKALKGITMIGFAYFRKISLRSSFREQRGQGEAGRPVRTGLSELTALCSSAHDICSLSSHLLMCFKSQCYR